MSEAVWAIVVAGGNGRRYGAAKQFEILGGRPVVEWAVNAARTAVDEVVLVLPKDQLDDARLHAGCAVVVAGGDTRSESVRAGLAAVPADVGIILVHDAARPLASPALFRAVITAIRNGADCAIPGVPVVDTVKRVVGDIVTETLDRNELVAVQTPQGFRSVALRDAHAGSPEATDDAALIEHAGKQVVVVPGEIENAKLTETADLAQLARSLEDRLRADMARK